MVRPSLLLTIAALLPLRTIAKVQFEPQARYAEVTMQVERCKGLKAPVTHCNSRYGVPNTDFAAKEKSSGRVSKVVAPTKDPAFMLTYRIMAREKTEIQLRLLDEHSNLVSWVTGVLDVSSLEQTPGLEQIPGSVSEVTWQASSNPEATSQKLHGNCTLKFWSGDAIAFAGLGVKESMDFEIQNSIAPTRAVRAADITGYGSLLVGVSPLPANLQGLWWLAGEGVSSTMLTFGGPNDDGGGCSSGFLVGPKNEYRIRMFGERSWASERPADADSALQAVDAAVHLFQFNSATIPTSGNIYSQSFDGTPYTGAAHRLLSNFTMTYSAAGDSEFPRSKVWLWKTAPLAQTLGGSKVWKTLKMIQVVGGDRLPIEPAWSKFKAHKSSTTGRTPEWMFYTSRYESPSEGAAAGAAKAELEIHIWGILGGLLSVCCACACCAAVIHRRKSRGKVGLYAESMGPRDFEVCDNEEDTSPFLHDLYPPPQHERWLSNAPMRADAPYM